MSGPVRERTWRLQSPRALAGMVASFARGQLAVALQAQQLARCLCLQNVHRSGRGCGDEQSRLLESGPGRVVDGTVQNLQAVDRPRRGDSPGRPMSHMTGPFAAGNLGCGRAAGHACGKSRASQRSGCRMGCTAAGERWSGCEGGEGGGGRGGLVWEVPGIWMAYQQEIDCGWTVKKNTPNRSWWPAAEKLGAPVVLPSSVVPWAGLDAALLYGQGFGFG